VEGHIGSFSWTFGTPGTYEYIDLGAIEVFSATAVTLERTPP
jgi:hypothetical protein